MAPHYTQVMGQQNLPILDISSPEFSTRSDDIYNARALSWCAKTPYGICVLRHKEAGHLLRDHRLRQGSYSWPDRNDLKGSFTEFWKRSIISQEGQTHKQMRTIMVKALPEAFIQNLKPNFVSAAETLIEPLISKTTCEFMSEFTIPFAGKAICALLGMPPEEWPQIASDASDLGLAMGVECKSHEVTYNAACDRLMALSDRLIAKVRNGTDTTSYISSLVSQIDDQSELGEQALRDMIVISIFGGVDTTKAQLGFLIGLFIDNPKQWSALKINPDLAANAIEESIRCRPTTTWATREAIEDFDFNGVHFKAGTTIHIMSHVTSTDPLIYSGQAFDITVKRKIHFGFGGGAHHCIGHLVARTDMTAALTVLAKTFEELHFDGVPEYLPDSGNTSPVKLPLKYRLS